jgi:hypothetical protein
LEENREVTMQRCIQIRTAKLYPESIPKELALFGILWGSLASCAPMASALFESRKFGKRADARENREMTMQHCIQMLTAKLCLFYSC